MIRNFIFIHYDFFLLYFGLVGVGGGGGGSGDDSHVTAAILIIFIVYFNPLYQTVHRQIVKLLCGVVVQ